MMLPRRVHSTDGRGNVDYSKTYFHVMSHALDGDEQAVAAEMHRPLSPTPAVTPSQRLQATNRGRAAMAHLASQQQETELENRLIKEEAQSRLAKVQRAVAAQVASRAPVPQLTWG